MVPLAAVGRQAELLPASTAGARPQAKC